MRNRGDIITSIRNSFFGGGGEGVGSTSESGSDGSIKSLIHDKGDTAVPCMLDCLRDGGDFASKLNELSSFVSISFGAMEPLRLTFLM